MGVGGSLVGLTFYAVCLRNKQVASS